METQSVPGMGEISGNVLFYSKPEPLTRELHGGLGVNRLEKPYAFAASAHIVPLNVTEFGPAALTGPIIFVGDQRMPCAVLGLNAGQNLFVKSDGTYENGVYIPAYIRRYPFVFANDQNAQQLILCIDRSAALIGEGAEIPFFDEKGEPTEYTKNCMQFCNDFEVERRRTEGFVQLLKTLDLLEKKEATFQPVNPDGTPGEKQVIAEYFGVSEERMKALTGDQLIELRDNGALPQIYAHLVSLVGWDRMIALQLAKQAEEQPQAANLN
jgi:hypothetical protein